MHTSWPTFIMWAGGGIFACLAQIMNYCGTPKESRNGWRQGGLCLGLLAVVLAGIAAWMTSIDWSTLPMTPEGLPAGSIWDNGGLPSIVESDERRATMEQPRRPRP
jgi:hypothetical protein